MLIARECKELEESSKRLYYLCIYRNSNALKNGQDKGSWSRPFSIQDGKSQNFKVKRAPDDNTMEVSQQS